MKRCNISAVSLIINLIIISLFCSVDMNAQSNVSLQTYKLIQEYKSNPGLYKSHNSNLGENIYNTLKVFIDYDSSLSIEELEKYGKISLKTSNILIASIPVDKIEEVAALPGVLRLSMEEQVEPTLDIALPAYNVTQVHNGEGLSQKYDGTGVIVGITDWGFDFEHEMFKTKDGIPRVKRAWLTHDESGVPPEGYKGSLYTDSNFIANKLIYSSDQENHGTHVMGIAAGTEIKGSKSTYRGVAPGADIVVAELYGVTKIDYPNATLPETVDYIFKYADSVNKPVVINMSLGSAHHPGDGTSSSHILLNQLIERNPYGRVIVASAGNNGNARMHYEYKFNNNDTLAVSINKEGTYNNKYGNRYLNIWGDVTNKFKAMVVIRNMDNLDDPTTTYKSGWYSTTKIDNVNDKLNGDITLYVGTDSSYIYNKKPYIEFIASGLKSKQLMTIYIVSENAHIHVWNSNAGSIYDEDMIQNIGDTKYTVGSPGIMDNIITIGASVSREKTESLTGKISGGWSGRLNDIANFSSKGPSTNGTIKPDIVGPGSVIYSALNPYCEISEYDENTNLVDETENGDYLYAMSGTSMSSPYVCGVVALMLQINPKLTQSEIKDILRITAVNDEFTGNAKINKNSIWGWGKVDALAIMKALENSTIKENKSVESKIRIATPLPIINDKINILYENKSINNMPSLVQIFDINGNLVFISSIDNEKEFDISNLANGSYFIKINDSSKSFIISR